MIFGIMPLSSCRIEETSICDIYDMSFYCADFFVSLFEGFFESVISIGKSVEGVPLVTVLLKLALVSLLSCYL